jgi:hypothetical protein
MPEPGGISRRRGLSFVGGACASVLHQFRANSLTSNVECPFLRELAGGFGSIVLKKSIGNIFGS